MIYVDVDSHNHVIFRYANIGRHFDLGKISPTRVKNGVYIRMVEIDQKGLAGDPKGLEID